MDLCECVSEYHRDDGEGEGLEEQVRLSYASRYSSLVYYISIKREQSEDSSLAAGSAENLPRKEVFFVFFPLFLRSN
jgi:hypothetical protein